MIVTHLPLVVLPHVIAVRHDQDVQAPHCLELLGQARAVARHIKHDIRAAATADEIGRSAVGGGRVEAHVVHPGQRLRVDLQGEVLFGGLDEGVALHRLDGSDGAAHHRTVRRPPVRLLHDEASVSGEREKWLCSVFLSSACV